VTTSSPWRTVDFALEHDEELVSGLPLFGEHRTFGLPNTHGEVGDVGEVNVREVLEQRDLPELLFE